ALGDTAALAGADHVAGAELVLGHRLLGRRHSDALAGERRRGGCRLRPRRMLRGRRRCGGRRGGLGRGGRCLRRRGAGLGFGVDDRDHLVRADGRPVLGEDLGDDAGIRRRQLEDDLVGLDVDQVLVPTYRFADLLVPLQERRLRDGFRQLRDLDFNEGHFWVTPNSGFMRRTRRRGVASGPLYWMRGRSLLRARLALAEGGGDQLFLLGEVLVEIPDRGRGGRRTTGVAELLARGQRLADVVLHVEPVALVLRLVLAPDDLRRGSEALELGLERLVREGVELLDADDRHIVRVALAPGRDEIVVDASGAQDHPLHAGRVDRRIGLADDGLVAARGEGLERRRRLLVPQQRLGR